MWTSAVAGFGLGLSLIVAIGAQNLFVLRQGLRRAHVLPVVLVCALSDAVLIALGVSGLGAVLHAVPWLLPVVRWVGAAFLLAYAALAARRAWRGEAVTNPDAAGTSSARPSLAVALATCLALTWLNPHVYLDTVFLLGSIAASHGETRWFFALGAMAGSVVWFFSLGYGARLLEPVFRSKTAWRILDAVIAAVMTGIALSLILGA